VSRAAITVVLLLAFTAQAASALHAVGCPMLQQDARANEPCSHCPPPPPEATLQAVLPDCCVVQAPVETSVSEPVRAPQGATSVALPPPHVVESPVAVPLARVPLTVSRAPSPPPPPRNLPLLS
jgi:hypothetical protein